MIWIEFLIECKNGKLVLISFYVAGTYTNIIFQFHNMKNLSIDKETRGRIKTNITWVQRNQDGGRTVTVMPLLCPVYLFKETRSGLIIQGDPRYLVCIFTLLLQINFFG